MEKSIIGKAVKMFHEEVFSSTIYRELARIHRGKDVGRKLEKLAVMEEKHASFWRRFLEKRGVHVGETSIDRVRVLLYKTLFKVLGLGLTLKLLEVGETKAAEEYSRIIEDSSISPEEKKELYEILMEELVHEHEFAEEEKKFKEFVEHIRDAVLGMSDGLVEVLSVSAGLAGAYGNPLYVALGGAIVGIGGALSMGIGAFTSVRAQKQVRMGILGRIEAASKYVAGYLVEKLRKRLAEKGLGEKAVDEVVRDVSTKPRLLARLVAEEGHGLKEEVLENPLKAGLYTGLSYIIGAFIPLLPYFFMLPITIAIPLSFLFAGLMLATTGFMIAVSAGLSIKTKITELILAGIGSATITFLVGRIASVLLGIEVG